MVCNNNIYKNCKNIYMLDATHLLPLRSSSWMCSQATQASGVRPSTIEALFVSHGMEAWNDSSQEYYVNLYYFWSSGMNLSGTRAKRTSPEGADDLCWYSVEKRALAHFCHSGYLLVCKRAATEEEEEASGRSGTAKMVHFRERCLGIFKLGPV